MNKDDTISKEYLLAEIEDLADEFAELDENGLHSERWCGIIDAKRVIMNTPSVSDRPQGEWIIEKTCNNNYNYRCSYCNWYERHDYPDGKPYNYCPNCGANMQEVHDE